YNILILSGLHVAKPPAAPIIEASSRRASKQPNAGALKDCIFSLLPYRGRLFNRYDLVWVPGSEIGCVEERKRQRCDWLDRALHLLPLLPRQLGFCTVCRTGVTRRNLKRPGDRANCVE